MTLFSKQCVLKICQGCSSFSSKQRNKDLGSGVNDCRHVLIYCGEHYRTCLYQRVRFDQFLKQSLFADAVYSGCAVTTSESLYKEQLKDRGCEVIHAHGDADVDIVKAATASAKRRDTTLVGEDTDLLILLLHYAERDSHRAVVGGPAMA